LTSLALSRAESTLAIAEFKKKAKTSLSVAGTARNLQHGLI
jgi:hypothetical protein